MKHGTRPAIAEPSIFGEAAKELADAPTPGRLGYLELGNFLGPPVIFFHGYPGSARQAMMVPDPKIFEHFRFVAFDRPGFGDSPPVHETAEFVAAFQHLLDRLGIGRFHILAVSGGTCDAFVMADHLRDRILSLTSVSSLGPLCVRELFMSMPRPVRLLFLLARYSPWTFAKLLAWARSKDSGAGRSAQAKFLVRILSPRDRAILLDPRTYRAFREARRYAFKQGALAVAREARRMQEDWGISDWQFPFPVRLFHGDEDRLVPLIHADWLHRQVAGSELTVVPGEGHYSLPILRLSEILSGLSAEFLP